ITEYIASSAPVGRRPRIARVLSYSSALRPSSDHGCGLSGGEVATATVSRRGASVTPRSYRPGMAEPTAASPRSAPGAAGVLRRVGRLLVGDAELVRRPERP